MVTQPPVSGLALFAGSSCSGPITVGSSPVRRLSRVEYDNMVRDLGIDPSNTQPATQFVTEQKIDNGKAGNFNTNAYATISGTLINQQYLEAAEALAAAAVANSNALAALLPSSSCGTKNAACASAFITTLGQSRLPRAARHRRDDGAQHALRHGERPVRLSDRHPGGDRGGAHLAALPLRPGVRSARAPTPRQPRFR